MMGRKIIKGIRVGPGGMRCPCCFPPPSSRERRYEFKRARRKEKQQEMKLQMEEMYG